MEASRKNLLDLSLRNRLLNFSPADPEHQDDARAHKFLVVKGRLKAVWDRLVTASEVDEWVRAGKVAEPE